MVVLQNMADFSFHLGVGIPVVVLLGCLEGRLLRPVPFVQVAEFPATQQSLWLW